MQVEVRLRGSDIPATLRDAVERRAQYAFGRFAPRLRRVTALVSDGGGGGEANCRVELRLRDGGRVVVAREGGPALGAVDGTFDRAARALVRHLGRARGDLAGGASVRSWPRAGGRAAGGA